MFLSNKWHYEYNAQVEEGEDPEEDAGSDSINGSTLQGVLDRESDTQVPLYADGSEEESTVVNGHVENKARQWAQGIGQVPLQVVHSFLHLEGQKHEEEEVRDGQVEQKNVDWCGFLLHFLPKGVEGQDIGGEAQHKGDDVDRETQPSVALLHVVFRFILAQVSGIEMCHVISLTLTLRTNGPLHRNV